ncbi:hypothetical protein BS47DRAFT_1352982, partial [Hydnum rufescens UP504]
FCSWGAVSHTHFPFTDIATPLDYHIPYDDIELTTADSSGLHQSQSLSHEAAERTFG